MLWTYSGLHPIFIYIPIKVQMFLTFQKPCVMFPLNFLALFLQLPLVEMSYVVPFSFILSSIPLVELSFVVLLKFVQLLIQQLALPLPLLALQMVPFYPSSFFVPLHLCFLVPSSFLSMRLLLPLLYYSFYKHFWRVCYNLLSIF